MNYWDEYFKGKNILKKESIREKRVALFLSFLLLGGIGEASVVRNLQINKKTVFENNNKKYSISDLYAAINSNKKLDNTEKMLLLNSWDLLKDYEDYIDFELAIKQLSNFDINYFDKEWENQINTTGDWNYITQTMNLYNVDEKEDILLKESAANHEICHLLNEKGEYFPNFLKEAINSLFCSEYFSQENAYYKQKIVIEMMCEIIDPGLIAKSYLQDDYQIIVNEFVKIDDDYDLINSLNKCFDDYQNLYTLNKDYYGIELDDEEKEKFLDNKNKTSEILNQINDILCHYFYKKTGIVVDSNYINYKNEDFYLNQYSIMNLYSTKLLSDDTVYNYDSKKYYHINTFKTNTAYFNKRNISDIEYDVDAYKLKIFGQKE